MGLFKPGQNDIIDVICVSTLVFCGCRVGGKIAGKDADRAKCLQFAGHTQHFQFGLDIEAVTGLDFDGRNAFGKQRIETGQGLRHQCIF